jgi:hypothetical protein
MEAIHLSALGHANDDGLARHVALVDNLDPPAVARRSDRYTLERSFRGTNARRLMIGCDAVI